MGTMYIFATCVKVVLKIFLGQNFINTYSLLLFIIDHFKMSTIFCGQNCLDGQFWSIAFVSDDDYFGRDLIDRAPRIGFTVVHYFTLEFSQHRPLFK